MMLSFPSKTPKPDASDAGTREWRWPIKLHQQQDAVLAPLKKQ